MAELAAKTRGAGDVWFDEENLRPHTCSYTVEAIQMPFPVAMRFSVKSRRRRVLAVSSIYYVTAGDSPVDPMSQSETD